MAEDRYIWRLDERVLDYVRFREFEWLEVGLIVLGLTGLAAYLLLVVLVDRRHRAWQRRQRAVATLGRWLEQWRLNDDEVARLYELAGAGNDYELYRFLTDPVRFERGVHAAVRRGWPALAPLAERMRGALGYTSYNLRAQVLSTRQLTHGDLFRLAVWEGGQPRHYYAELLHSDAACFTLGLSEAAARSVSEARGEVDLFFLRGQDREYRFPFHAEEGSTDPPRARVRHALVQAGHRARAVRLPVMERVTYEVGPTPEGFPDHSGEGLLMDLSEGGFALLVREPAEPGHYASVHGPAVVEAVPLTARVLDSRPFAGNRWVLRCELEGMLPSHRKLLRRALRREQQQRLRRMRAPARRANAGEGQSAG